MTLPPWLHYAESGENLDDFILSPIPPTLETLPALTLAFECAKESILSPTGLTTLNQTFAQKDIPSAVFEQELNESEIYVIKWIERERKESTYNREPFHITPENLPNKAVVVGNIFIDLPDAHYFLPRGDAVHWTKTERHRVVLMSWFILHAAVQALVSILYQKQIVKPSRPFQLAFPGIGRRQLDFLGGDHKGKAFGNRSWLMEDRLGGRLCFLEAEDRLVISRPEASLSYPFTGQMVADFLSCDQGTYAALYPLTHHGPGQYFEDELRTRRRAAYPPPGLPEWYFRESIIHEEKSNISSP